MNIEFAVRDEQNGDVTFRGRPMFHLNSGWKPDEVARPKSPGVRQQSPVDYVHAVRAGVDMTGVDDACRVTDDPDLGTGFGIFNQVLSEKSLSEMLIPAPFPWNGGGVYGCYLIRFHWNKYMADTCCPAWS